MDGSPATDEIAGRLAAVERRIVRAAERAGRDPRSVRLITITKGFPTEVVRSAYAAGVRRFGENRVEEARPKMAALTDLSGIEWHLVGTVQSRKARLVGDGFALIHSIDRVKIARRLSGLAAEAGRRQAILLECNLTGEASKAGWRVDPDGAGEADLLEQVEVAGLAGLSLRGLMTMAPLGAAPEHQRRVFRGLAEARDRLADRLGHPLPELSMGMTDDFEAAVEEGATLVRIGRAIFGERM